MRRNDQSTDGAERAQMPPEAAFVAPIIMFGIALLVAGWYVGTMFLTEIISSAETEFLTVSPTILAGSLTALILVMAVAISFSEPAQSATGDN